MPSTPLAIDHPISNTVEAFLDASTAASATAPHHLLFSNKKAAETFRRRAYGVRAHHAKIARKAGRAGRTPWDHLTLIVEPADGETFALVAYTDDSCLGIVQAEPGQLAHVAQRLRAAEEK